MSDSCATCFFFRAAPASAGQFAGATHCHFGAPRKDGPADAYPWRPVPPDEWCGEGVDAVSGRGYSAATGAAPIDPAVISDSGR